MTPNELKTILENIKNDDDIIDLFCSQWNYKYNEKEIPNSVLSEDLEDQLKYAKIIANDENDILKVILVRVNYQIQSKSSKKTTSAIIRKIHRSLSETYRNSLIIVVSEDYHTIVFSQVRTFDKSIRIRKFIIELNKIYWTPVNQLIKLDLSQDNNIKPLEKLEACFDIDAVSEEFFNDYKKIFDEMVEDITNQIKNKFKAHDFVQQFFNRLMFLYFLQKKGWLDNDKSFVKNFWQNYQENRKSNSNFYEDYLKPLFFEALRFGQGRKILEAPNMPESLKDRLQMFPYLNGSLFKDNEVDDLNPIVKDEFLQKAIDDFLENYNFTIDEESPLDIELSVDPVMLGMVYESLINSAERGKAGIFYTDKVELDMMCRLSLTRYLIKNTNIDKIKIYQWIFDEENEKIKPPFSKKEVNDLYNLLENIKVVDPACGSGGYLVTFLNLLFSLIDDLTQKKNQRTEPFNLKKKIIEHSLYGVDVKSWAINIARLRLWLNLIIDADDSLKDSFDPLLPALDFKIRKGDSLVQEIAGIPITIGETKKYIKDSNIKRKITEIINRKRAFYNNQEYAGQKQSLETLFRHETNIFREILLFQKKNLIQPKIKQEIMFKLGNDFEQKSLIEEQNKEKIAEIDKISANLNEFTKEKAFWAISFAEVFADEKQGFDIVIANPPYVRQESIAPPEKENPKLKDKTEYKKELNKCTQYWFPNWFPKHKLSGRSDLYIFFYLLGLKLLNPNGVFCYISENSWLDVGYGKELQEFLLKNVPVKMIIDNQVKRSFKSASVNTIVAIFDAPTETNLSDNLVQFINFKKEFEAINNSNTFLDIENHQEPSNNKPITTEKYRLFNITHKQLEENGSEGVKSGVDHKEFQGKVYIGDKWGGKYLRAPDIYWTILEKGKGKLVRLGDIAEVRRGFTTGANEFFYLEDVTDELEEG